MSGLRGLILIVAAGAAVIASGCDECALDAERFCDCSDGRTGTQLCTDEGTFGECNCVIGPVPVCGDGRCDRPSGEERTCPTDCRMPTCGDTVCDFTESVFSCPTDCPGFCGDGACDFTTETETSCPGDCPGMTFCGDRACDPGETIESCPADCGRACDFEPSGIEQPISDATETVDGAPSMALDRGVWWIAWIGRDASTLVSTAHLAAATSGAVSQRALATDTPVQGISVTAQDGVVAVAWIDSSGSVVLTVRTGLVTEVLPPTPIAPGRLGTALESDLITHSFILSWADDDGIQVARFTLDGVAAGPRATVPGTPATAPSLEPTGSGGAAVAWVDAGASREGVHVATVGEDGTVTTSGVPIFSGALSTDPPGLASTGLALVVAWSEADMVGYNIADFRGATGGSRMTFAAGGGTDGSPTAVFAGTESIIGWSGSFTPGNRDLLAARIDGAGAPTGTITTLVSGGATGISTPQLAWDGVDIGATWIDHRDGFGAVWFTTTALCF